MVVVRGKIFVYTKSCAKKILVRRHYFKCLSAWPRAVATWVRNRSLYVSPYVEPLRFLFGRADRSVLVDGPTKVPWTNTPTRRACRFAARTARTSHRGCPNWTGPHFSVLHNPNCRSCLEAARRSYSAIASLGLEERAARCSLTKQPPTKQLSIIISISTLHSYTLTRHFNTPFLTYNVIFLPISQR